MRLNAEAVDDCTTTTLEAAGREALSELRQVLGTPELCCLAESSGEAAARLDAAGIRISSHGRPRAPAPF